MTFSLTSRPLKSRSTAVLCDDRGRLRYSFKVIQGHRMTFRSTSRSPQPGSKAVVVERDDWGRLKHSFKVIQGHHVTFRPTSMSLKSLTIGAGCVSVAASCVGLPGWTGQLRVGVGRNDDGGWQLFTSHDRRPTVELHDRVDERSRTFWTYTDTPHTHSTYTSPWATIMCRYIFTITPVFLCGCFFLYIFCTDGNSKEYSTV